MTPESKNASNLGDWSECPIGEFDHLAKRLRIQRRQRQMSQIAGTTGLLVVLLALSMFIPQFVGGTPVLGELTCLEVIDQAEEYVAHRMSDAMSGRVEVHLVHCQKCREYIDVLKNSQQNLDATPSLQDNILQQVQPKQKIEVAQLASSVLGNRFFGWK